MAEEDFEWDLARSFVILLEISAIAVGVVMIGTELGEHFDGAMGSHNVKVGTDQEIVKTFQNFGASILVGIMIFAIGLGRIGMRVLDLLEDNDPDS